MSKVVKGVKKVFKGVAKVVRSIGREVRRFVKSDLFKVVLVAAAVFTAGAALGAWAAPSWFPAALGGGPTAGVTAGANAATQAAVVGGVDTAALTGSSISSQILAGGGPGAAAAGGAADLAALTQASTTLGQGVAAAGTTGGAAAGTGAGLAATTPQLSGPAAITGGATTAAETAALQASSGVLGISAPPAPNAAGAIFKRIQSMTSGALQFAKDNQMLTATAVNALGNAFTPSEAEVLEDMEDKRYDRMLRAYDFSGVDTSRQRQDFTTGRLRNTSGEPVYNEEGGIINRRRRYG